MLSVVVSLLATRIAAMVLLRADDALIVHGPADHRERLDHQPA